MNKKTVLHLDYPLMYALLLMSFLSLIILFSAGGENLSILMRQAARMLAAFVVMLAVAQIPPEALARWTPWIYGVGVILLVVVLGIGVIGKGAQRWIDLGLFRFQPSEVMKLGVPMMAAWIFSRKPLPPSPMLLIIGAVAIGLPTALIILQPDLGTSILVAASGVFVIFLAGIHWRILAGLSVIAGALLPVAWHFMHDYQKRRVLTLFNPEADPLGSGYHIIQAKIAIGSGGIYGKGWTNGSQSQLDFIPERHTDFIFAVFGEEFGLIGAITLLSIYSFIIGRCLYIAIAATDTYSRLLAGSLGITFFFYVFVNIGMVSGILPVVGVPLPLVSYGGTSMVTLMAGFGILMSIHSRRRFISS